MKKVSAAIAVLCALSVFSPCRAGFFEDVVKGASSRAGTNTPDGETIVDGLKEALAIGTKNAVNHVGKTDGYFGNSMIRILLPERIRNVGDFLSKIGFRTQVDDFILSMNRAAEKAAPLAAGYFADALKEMTFDDAIGIWKGGNTSATEYFRRKTHDRIYRAFRPVVASSMGEVGVTRSYQAMIRKYESFPFMKSESLDLDGYVTDKALDGLFYMVGEEERKIRTNPAARVTDLLRKVFGG